MRPRSRGQVPPPDSCCGGSRRVPGQHQQMARCPEGCWAQPLDPTATHSRSSQTLGGAPSWCRQQALLGFAFLVKIQEWEGKMLEHAEPPSLVCPELGGCGRATSSSQRLGTKPALREKAGGENSPKFPPAAATGVHVTDRHTRHRYFGSASGGGNLCLEPGCMENRPRGTPLCEAAGNQHWVVTEM